MRSRILIAGLPLAAAAAVSVGCVATLSYDDYGDQKSGTTNDAGVVCTPKTCADKNANCGDVPDDCGKILNCGECGNGETCGGAGPNQCGSGPCQPETCNSLGAFCGTASDGCGKTLQCGPCSEPKTCGGAGVPNQCGCESTVTCGELGAECGQIDDGCGGTTTCGNCPDGMKCSDDNSAGGIDGAHKCVCANDPCLNYPNPCGYVLNCMANSVLCPCQNGANCQITPPSDVGTCG
jgi:hypothetical protein